MTVGEQARWWGLALLALILLVWLLSGAITPFLAGMAIAYFLDPLADRLERRGLSRLGATVVVTAVVILVAVGSILILIPVLADQVARVAGALPDYVSALQKTIQTGAERYAPEAFDEDGLLQEAFANLREQVQNWSVRIAESVYSGGVALIDFLLLMIVTPVVAFYMLLDWDRMVSAIDHWLPRRHAPQIRQVARDIDKVLAGFVRGQLTVCMILGTFYAVSLVIIGLNFGILVGLFAGLISFIPFVGSLTGGALSIGIAVYQFWDDPIWIVVVAAVFLVGQAVEGNFLTPKLVGDSVGLHPVWLMFALSAFGAAMGFVGLLIAVPAAAAIGVLARFALEQYRQGRLYLGGEPLKPDDPDHARERTSEAAE